MKRFSLSLLFLSITSFCYPQLLQQQKNSSLSCTNWLYTPSFSSSVTVGDLDITGNQLTVEVNYNSIANSSNGSWGHLVSKHTNTTNVNYAISPNGAEITTSTGYKVAAQTCPIVLNKNYHTALVYDGSSLKFYRNGFLLSQVPCTGNLVNNNLLTTISQVAGTAASGEQFTGYVNEVRIWNVARTQSQIQAYMNNSLPSPATQTGLMAYYTFDDLLNKQGNAVYNGVINGPASINSTNSQCTLVEDSCGIKPVNTISGIINQYTPVLAVDKCKNIITVGDGTIFNTGDTVLLIQMKGAVIDSSNTAAFGTVTDYKNAGNYEFNYIKSITGNQVELLNALTKQYDIPAGKVQLIRVPYYQNVTVSSTLTCKAWDGSTGGVLVFNAADSVILNADIDVSGKGFRGGNDPVSNPLPFYCYENDYYYPQNPDLASEKGEGIALISSAKSFGKGALANGGGGGNSHNSGGGGGGNAASGGLGGYQYEFTPCNGTVPFDNRGISGKSLTYSNAAGKIFLGGGGGAGQSNNPEAFESDGGNGAGIIIIQGNKLKGNGKKIIANGNAAALCGQTTSGCHEGMGGGGAAGTVLLNINSYLGNTVIEANGGKGGDMTAAGFYKVAPGGGGGGGIVWLSNAALPAGLTVSNAGGLNGVCTAYSNDAWGAAAGQQGASLFNLQLPTANIAFKPNIDSVRIKDSITSCQSFSFKGFGYTNTNPVASWQWYFGDGGTATTQNTSHTYSTTGQYNVKLVVTDINGCKDSIPKLVAASPLSVDAIPDMIVCNNAPFTLNVTAPGAVEYAWTPRLFLNDSTLQSPTATVSSSTKFYVTAKNAVGCTAKDSVTATVHTAAMFAIDTPAAICGNNSVQLNAYGATSYLWSPANLVNNPVISNPVTVNLLNTQLFTVKVKYAACDDSTELSALVTVSPPSSVKAVKSNDIDCNNGAATLFATGSGGVQFQWSPAADLDNPGSATAVASPKTTTTYYVTVTDANGCITTDSVTVNVSQIMKGGYGQMPNAFSPNGDGRNDCFGIKYWGQIEELEFLIYNRYGEKVFYTTDPNKCWNGLFKTDKPEPGNYVYYIKAKTACGMIEKKGNVLLLK